MRVFGLDPPQQVAAPVDPDKRDLGVQQIGPLLPRFAEGVEQGTGASLLTPVPSLAIKAAGGTLAVTIHQRADQHIVGTAVGREIGGLEVSAEDGGAERLDDLERSLGAELGQGEVAAPALGLRHSLKRRGLAPGIANPASQLQPLLEPVESLLRPFQIDGKTAEIGHGDRLAVELPQRAIDIQRSEIDALSFSVTSQETIGDTQGLQGRCLVLGALDVLLQRAGPFQVGERAVGIEGEPGSAELGQRGRL